MQIIQALESHAPAGKQDLNNYSEVRAHPDVAAIHAEIERAGLKNARVQAYGQAHNSNEVLIQLDIQETSEQALDKGKIQIIQALESHAPRASRTSTTPAP